MRKRKIFVVFITFLLSFVLCVNVFATYDDGKRYYYNDDPRWYHANNPETGITLIRSFNQEFEGSVMDVTIITSGDLYDKYSEYFDGEITIYDISVTNQGKEVEIGMGDSFVELIFPDDDFTEIKTADIYHINDDGTITALPTWRDWLMDANGARITSFGLFIRAESKLINDSNLIPFTPIPTFTPTPKNTPEPTFAYPPIGDVNLDYSVNADDALLVLKVAAKLEELSSFSTGQGDINADEIIDAEDALMILKIAAKID